MASFPSHHWPRACPGLRPLRRPRSPAQRSHSQRSPESRSIDARSLVELARPRRNFRLALLGTIRLAATVRQLPKIAPEKTIPPQADTLIRFRLPNPIPPHNSPRSLSTSFFLRCDLFSFLSCITNPRFSVSPS